MNSPEDCSCLAKGQTSGLTRPARLVGMHHRLAQDEVLQRGGKRCQPQPADAHPLGHRRARDVHAAALVDLFLAVQRQMVVVLGDDDLG